PALLPHTLLLCLVILFLVTMVNLRGLREAGLVFLIPTYAFIGTMLITLGWGIVKAVVAGGHPTPVAAPPRMHTVVAALGVWVMLKAFSSGCTAMTGVEAVSNGVKAFRDPVVKTAQRTLTSIIALLIVFLAGIAYLAHAYHIGATNPGAAGYESVLSQLIAAVAGRKIFYDVSIGSILIVLALSANTAFADFPRVCRMVAQDRFLPVPFIQRGRRLVYSQGVYVLAIVCALLLIVFDGVTDRLIPLYAVGAFLAFTLSQAGMVAHWVRKGGAKARRSMCINGLGALATAGTVIVITISKFVEGAWITTLIIPAIMILMYSIRRHYDRVAVQIADPNPLSLRGCERPIVVVPLLGWNKVAEKALQFALTLSSEVQAVHVENEDEPDDICAHWYRCVQQPAAEAGLAAPPLTIVKSPYRFIVNPIVDFVMDVERKNPDRQIAVVVPELIEHHWYQYVLHNQRPKWLKAMLLVKGTSRIVIVTVPWFLTQ
ncbi:MAG: APC family permease, partial [Terriglobia bacterium]